MQQIALLCGASRHAYIINQKEIDQQAISKYGTQNNRLLLQNNDNIHVQINNDMIVCAEMLDGWSARVKTDYNFAVTQICK